MAPSLVKIKLNREAVRELLKSPEIIQDMETRARRIADHAGEGHTVETFEGKVRARVSIRTETFEAMAREARDRNLTRSVDAGR